MGPRLDSRGEEIVVVQSAVETRLQWGRGSIAAESSNVPVY